MSKQLRQLQKNQTNVTVARRAQNSAEGIVWLATLVAFAAGVFYFWYYFWGAPGSVLIGN